MILFGFTIGLSVAVVKTNPEFEKVIPHSRLRDIFLLVSPFAIIAMLAYTVASKSFSTRSLFTEVVIILIGYASFLIVTAPYFLMKTISDGEKCRFWQISCESTRQVPDFLLVIPFLLAAGALCYVLWRRERPLP